MNKPTPSNAADSELLPELKHVTIVIDPALHTAMREIARRKRMNVGRVYEECIEAFLNQTNNYLGKKAKR